MAESNAAQPNTIPAIVKMLKERTGISYKATISRMSDLLGWEYTIDRFNRKFRAKQPARSYDTDELVALIKVYTSPLIADRRCTVDEAFRLFDLANIPRRDFQQLEAIFPGEVVQRQWRHYQNNPAELARIRRLIRNFDGYIDDKTRNFVGRQFVFDAIQQFVEANSSGYFIIRGDPGIGKTALMAQLVKTQRYIHYFNIRAEGINQASDFLRSICAQLVHRYRLEYTDLPPEAGQDSGFLNHLLAQVALEVKRSGEPCIVVVDALDEADSLGVPTGENIMYFPVCLPEGVYIVATARRETLNLRVDAPLQYLDIEHDTPENDLDVRRYVVAQYSRPGILTYISNWRLDGEHFVELLVKKSEGNFMYLHYVLPEIENGSYRVLPLETLPSGLVNYYEDHWQRMKLKNPDAWFDYKLPVLVALTAVFSPVSIDLIQDFSKVASRARIHAVLDEWSPFLHAQKVTENGSTQIRYRFYHLSFLEFVEEKQEVQAELIDLTAMHMQISRAMIDALHSAPS